MWRRKRAGDNDSWEAWPERQELIYKENQEKDFKLKYNTVFSLLLYTYNSLMYLDSRMLHFYCSQRKWGEENMGRERERASEESLCLLKCIMENSKNRGFFLSTRENHGHVYILR